LRAAVHHVGLIPATPIPPILNNTQNPIPCCIDRLRPHELLKTALSTISPLRPSLSAKLEDLGFDEFYVHNAGRNQEEFIRAYGERVILELRWAGE